MKLFLCSSSITPELRLQFEGFIGRPTKGLKVAFIPDAAYGELGATWLEEEIEYQKNDLGFDLTVFKLAEHTPDTIKKLLDFDAIFIAGGLVVDMHRLMLESGFTDLLPTLLKKEIVYIGSSASSMIMSEVQDAAVWYIGEEEPDAKDIRGFGLIDFQIYPHFEEKYREEIFKKINPKYEYWLLSDGTALALDDHSIKICGESVEIIKRGS